MVTQLEEAMRDLAISTVCQVCETTPEEILSRSRKQEIAFARHLTMYILHGTMSATKVGELLGRSHASVLHGCKNITDMLDVPQAYPEECACISKVLRLQSSR